MAETHHDSLSLTGNIDVAGNSTVSGNSAVTGNFSVTGTSSFTGDSSIGGDLAVTGDVAVTGAFTAPFISETCMTFHEDFLEGANSLASTHISKFFTGGGTNGTQAVVSSKNGVIQLDTSATASSDSTLAFTNAAFDNTGAWTFETHIKTDALTNRRIFAGMRVDANDYVGFVFDTEVNAANIYLVTKDNGATEASTDTGVDLTTATYVTLRISVNSDNTFSAFINGQQVAASHSGTIRAVSFVPFWSINNKAETQSNKLDVDYLKVRQSR